MLPDSNKATYLLYAILPIIISALLNAGEAAIIYTDDSNLRHMGGAGDRKAAKILRLLKGYKSLETSVLAATTICLSVCFYGFWNLFNILSLEGLISEGAVFAFSISVGLVLFLSLGKITPRRLAAYFYESIAFPLIGILQLAKFLMLPAVYILNSISWVIIRIFGQDPNHISHRVTEEEIRMLVDEGEERGVIEEQEKDMINNIFEFDDRTVDEVMTHRTEVSAADINSTLEQLVAIALETGYSRIPIYEDDIDSVIGILYAKDLLKFFDKPSEFKVVDHMRKPLYIPETTKCTHLFAIFKHERTQIAVVVDEYGGTYGIVTMEDLLESIVGNMQDEYDNEGELVTKSEDGVYLLDGSLTISRAQHLLEIRIPDDSESDTLGGFITELLGGVPRENDTKKSVQFGGVNFTVIEADERKILSIRAVITSPDL